ncbi:DUF4345 domain-containing protein [Notoacmeibacter sp. MSK16QG-6]|uniref:DUF4345 domain-containing protein n=1 Tax=Notoacmeibacter sp. MSK16QG-6 TaxID=2957982 RepID=UPI00209D5D95|nr:DUF4345 domain-containing protein [Notoacmeibacter sp. MSK16QG-6]MCP1200966.1 DUF4345 domain-containing protein [Notoacmeibacter sp. MSK16QG-6]
MEFALPIPADPGEWLALASAVVTAVLGLYMMAVPRRALGLRHMDAEFIGLPASGIARARAGGFHLGLGLAAILLWQPLLFLALGAAWIFAAIGRLLSVLIDSPARGRNAVLLIIEALLAFGAVAGPLSLI